MGFHLKKEIKGMMKMDMDNWLDLKLSELNQELEIREANVPVSGRIDVLARTWDRPVSTFAAQGGLDIGGVLPLDGIGTLAPARIRVMLPADGVSFSSLIGLDRNQAKTAWRRPLPPFEGTAVFTISIGGCEIFRSCSISLNSEPLAVSVDLAGAKEFILEVHTSEDLPFFAWAAWGEAVVRLADGQQLRLSAMPVTQPESLWRRRDAVIAWGFAQDCPSHVGHIEITGGFLGSVRTLDKRVVVTDADCWQSEAIPAGNGCSITVPILYRESDSGPDRTIITITLGKQVYTFLPNDLVHGPILLRDLSLGITDRAAHITIEEHLLHLQEKGDKTIRERVRELPEFSWEEDLRALRGPDFKLPPLTINQREGWPPFFEPVMQVEVPDKFLSHFWRAGGWSIVRHFTYIHREDLTLFGKVAAPKSALPYTDNLRILSDVEDPRGCWLPTGVWQPLAVECDRIIQALDHLGLHKIASDCLDLWLVNQKPDGGLGLDTIPEQNHVIGQLTMPWITAEHYRLTGDRDWLIQHKTHLQEAIMWIIRRRYSSIVNSITPEDQERIRCGKQAHPGLQPSLAAGDGGDRGFIWADMGGYQSVRLVAEVLAEVDSNLGRELLDEADAYRDTLLPVVEAAVALSPLMCAQDGLYRRYLPQGFSDRGPLHQIEPAGSDMHRHWGTYVADIILPTVGIECLLRSKALPLEHHWLDEFYDLLEDRFIFDHPWYYVRLPGFCPERDWDRFGGWFYQSPWERLPEYYLQKDDIPNFLRAWQRRSAADMYFVGDPFGDPRHEDYMFKEHTWFNVYDKQQNRAAFLSNFRNMLVMEIEQDLWLARATPRKWLEQGKKIKVMNSPTYFGTVDYEIISDVDNNRINATINMPSRKTPMSIVLRLRHPEAAHIKSVTVDGVPWTEFSKDKETITLKGFTNKVLVTVQY